MRFLADENFPKAAVVALRQSGGDVDWALESSPAAIDATLLARALRTGAVILTFDKDFGELAQGVSSAGGFGVVLFRIPMPKSKEAGESLARLVRSRDDWEGHISVAEPGRIRMRALSAYKSE
jgi:predicted nuclease of predicted toxin-antitoxin system